MLVYFNFKLYQNIYLGKNNITLNGVERRDLANLIISTNDELDKLIKSMNIKEREDTINSLMYLIVHTINYSDNITYDTIMNQVNKSVERMSNQKSTRSQTIQVSPKKSEKST